jgi:hypothetical protein
MTTKEDADHCVWCVRDVWGMSVWDAGVVKMHWLRWGDTGKLVWKMPAF